MNRLATYTNRTKSPTTIKNTEIMYIKLNIYNNFLSIKNILGLNKKYYALNKDRILSREDVRTRKGNAGRSKQLTQGMSFIQHLGVTGMVENDEEHRRFGK